MRRLDLPQRRVLPSRWAMLVLLACIIASLFIALNAGGAEPKAAATSAAAADKTPAKPAPAKPDVSVPPKPEESATIEDDPTIAPDPKQSADNDITFPVDI
jgi:hypothetical protein